MRFIKSSWQNETNNGSQPCFLSRSPRSSILNRQPASSSCFYLYTQHPNFFTLMSFVIAPQFESCWVLKVRSCSFTCMMADELVSIQTRTSTHTLRHLCDSLWERLCSFGVVHFVLRSFTESRQSTAAADVCLHQHEPQTSTTKQLNVINTNRREKTPRCSLKLHTAHGYFMNLRKTGSLSSIQWKNT